MKQANYFHIKMDSNELEIQNRIENAVKNIDELKTQNTEVRFLNNSEELDFDEVVLIMGFLKISELKDYSLEKITKFGN